MVNGQDFVAAVAHVRRLTRGAARFRGTQLNLLGLHCDDRHSQGAKRELAGAKWGSAGLQMRASASATHVSSGFEALPEVGEVGFETALGYVFASAFLLVFVLRRPEEDE